MENRSNFLIAVCFFVFYSAVTLFVTSPQMTPTGDEPHYLITACSLAVDHDINLYNNYVKRHYRLFYPWPLPRRTTRSPDRLQELPAVGLGVALFLSPFFSIALRFFPAHLLSFLHLIMCSIATIAIYQILGLLSSVSDPKSRGLPIVLAAGVSSPLICYASLFYPELLAFLFLVIALRQFQEMEIRPVRAFVWLSLIPGALIWLHPKYLALSLVVFGLSIWYFRKFRYFRMFHIVVAAGGILSFFLFLHHVYGSWSPNRIYGGEQKEVSLIGLLQREGIKRFWTMLRMFFGYWIDQRFGLLPYAPLYIAFFPALIWFARKNRSRIRIPLVTLFVVHFAVLCWTAQLGGHSPPGRHFVVMISLILIPIATAFPHWQNLQKVLLLVLALTGWIVAGTILSHFSLVFTDATWHNPEGLSQFWTHFHLQQAIPNLTASHPQLLLIAAWTLVISFLAFLLYPRHSTLP